MGLDVIFKMKINGSQRKQLTTEWELDPVGKIPDIQSGELREGKLNINEERDGEEKGEVFSKEVRAANTSN